MTRLLEGKAGIVTGAGSGIGRATAIAAAEAGSKVVVAEIDVDSGNDTVEMVRKIGGEAEFIETDVSDPTAIVRMVDFTVDRFGGLDWACNNAARGRFGPFIETTDDEWEKTIATTLGSVFHAMRAQVRVMLEAGSGSIVNISSRTGVTGTALEAVYAAAKGGVEALSKSVAAEYAQHGIRVNTIAPGPIKTPSVASFFGRDERLTKKVLGVVGARRLGEPEEIAQAAVWLASDRCNYLNGETLMIDGATGGNSVFN